MSGDDHKDNLRFKLSKGTDDQTDISKWTIADGSVQGNCPQCNGFIYATFSDGDFPIEATAVAVNSARLTSSVTLICNCDCVHPGCHYRVKGCGWFGDIHIS